MKTRKLIECKNLFAQFLKHSFEVVKIIFPMTRSVQLLAHDVHHQRLLLGLDVVRNRDRLAVGARVQPPARERLKWFEKVAAFAYCEKMNALRNGTALMIDLISSTLIEMLIKVI